MNPDRWSAGSGTPLEQPCGSEDLVELLSSKIVGQQEALRYIVPYIQMYQAGLAPSGRPAGVFLLLGPTGTGKTRTVEALAEVLHGTEKGFLRIDCGEFQSDHEVAKLIGAPPGYLGHRETKPLLSQHRLSEVTSDRCGLSLVLFDEIEKAAPALSALLLGVLDKATLRLGDGSEVSFEQSLIFLTSNLGAREMLKEVTPRIGFSRGAPPPAATQLAERLESIGVAAVRKRFSPEFVNRLDVIVTYRPLDDEALSAILDHHLVDLRRHVKTRLGDRSFGIDVSSEARRLLLQRGTSREYGARELKRVFHRWLVQPLAAQVAEGAIPPGSHVRVDVAADGETFDIRCEPAPPHARSDSPTVIVVDDNLALLEWFRHTLTDAGFRVVTAGTVADAIRIAAETGPVAALLDFILPDGDGVALAVHLTEKMPGLQVVVMSGTELPAEESAVCSEYGFALLVKPFLGGEMVGLVRALLLNTGAETGSTAR